MAVPLRRCTGSEIGLRSPPPLLTSSAHTFTISPSPNVLLAVEFTSWIITPEKKPCQVLVITMHIYMVPTNPSIRESMSSVVQIEMLRLDNFSRMHSQNRNYFYSVKSCRYNNYDHNFNRIDKTYCHRDPALW